MPPHTPAATGPAPRGEVISKRRAAKQLGAPYSAVCALIAGNEIPTFDMPSNGNAHGIDAPGLERLRPLVEALLRRTERSCGH